MSAEAMLEKARVRADCESLERECRELRHRLDRLDLEENWREFLLSVRESLQGSIAFEEMDS